MPTTQAIPDNEILSTRIFPVSSTLLFRAFAEPAHLKNWWGPAGFTNTFHVFDFTPGGKWKLTMHGPDKGHYENEAEFVQIEAPRLIVWKRISKPLFDVQIQLEEITAQATKLYFKMVFPTVEDCNKVRAFVPEKNEENFDRLEQELSKMTA